MENERMNWINQRWKGGWTDGWIEMVLSLCDADDDLIKVQE